MLKDKRDIHWYIYSSASIILQKMCWLIPFLQLLLICRIYIKQIVFVCVFVLHVLCKSASKYTVKALNTFQIEQLMRGLMEETDTRQAEIFHQRQMVSDQMSEATCAINVTTSRLVAMVEAMQDQLLSQLYTKLTDADDYLSKVKMVPPF